MGGVAIKGKKRNKEIQAGLESQNFIIKFNQESTVMDLRLNKGWGARKIAQYYLQHHDELLPKDAPTISESCLNRYFRTKKINRLTDISSDEAVNIYQAQCESLKNITAIADAIYNRIEECTRVDQEDQQYDTKLLMELSKSYRELDTRKSALVASIGTMQAKVYTWSASGEIVSRTLEFVQQRDPKLAYDLKEFLSSDPMLNECMKRIKNDV